MPLELARRGLDYYHCKEAALRERQAAVFGKVIVWRNPKPAADHPLRDAEQQALKMVKNLEKVIFHAPVVTLAL